MHPTVPVVSTEKNFFFMYRVFFMASFVIKFYYTLGPT